VRYPPIVGPMIEEIPNTPAKMPCILARVFGGKRSAMTVKTLAMSTPPKTP